MIKRLDDYIRMMLYLLAFLLPLAPYAVINVLTFVLLMMFIGARTQEMPASKALEKNGLWMVLVFIVLIYATVFSVSFKTSLVEFIRYGNGFILLLMIQWYLTTKESIFRFLQAIVLSTTAVAAYGIFQYFFRRTAVNTWVDTELHPDIEIRVTSIMQNPNNLAEFLVIIIPIVFAVFLYKRQVFHKLMAVGMAGILMACLLVTYSRSAYLGFLVAIVIFVLLIEVRFIVFAPVMVGVGLIWMPAGLQSRLNSLVESMVLFLTNPLMIKDTSVSYRISIWGGAVRAIKEFFWYGAGLGNKIFSMIYPFYSGNAAKADHAHNLYLEWFVELGVIGAVVLLIFVLNILRLGVVSIYRTNSRYIKMMTGGTIAGVMAFLMTGVTEYNLYYYKGFYGFFMMLGVLMALYNVSKEEEAKDDVINREQGRWTT